jgi:hypothetical protein
MTRKNRGRAATGAAALLATALLVPADAAARASGHPHRGGVVVVGGGFYGPWLGYGAGWAWGPWGFYGPGGYGGWGYPPAFYIPEGGVPMGVAMMSGFGGVDLDVKPGRADVWVDGKYVGEARDLDGYPSYLWLKEGVHRLQIQKGGYRLFDEQIEMQAGWRKDLRVRLEPGESAPPAPKPAAGTTGNGKDEKPREKKY